MGKSMRIVIGLSLLLLLLIDSVASAQLSTGWKAHDLDRPQPKVVTASLEPGGPPSDAVVLFDGTDLSQWLSSSGGDPKWRIVDGAMESVPRSGYVVSKQKFGDCQVHVEFASPETVKGSGQGRGNSGVFLMGEFEVQVLDSYENETYSDGSAGSIYGQYPPLVNASRLPGQWQSYDIVFKRPRFDDQGKLQSSAQLTVFHNGVLIQNANEALGPTNWIRHKSYEKMKGKVDGPLSLQDHGNPVRYRNIWVRNLASVQRPAKVATDSVPHKLTQDQADNLIGQYGGHRVIQSGDDLSFVFNGNTPLTLVAKTSAEFEFKETAGALEFEMDEDGNAIGIEIHLDAAGVRKAKRGK
jgi:hypothetical protein